MCAFWSLMSLQVTTLLSDLFLLWMTKAVMFIYCRGRWCWIWRLWDAVDDCAEENVSKESGWDGKTRRHCNHRQPYPVRAGIEEILGRYSSGAALLQMAFVHLGLVEWWPLVWCPWNRAVTFISSHRWVSRIEFINTGRVTEGWVQCRERPICSNRSGSASKWFLKRGAKQIFCYIITLRLLVVLLSGEKQRNSWELLIAATKAPRG